MATIEMNDLTMNMENEDYVRSLEKDGFIEYDENRNVYVVSDSAEQLFQLLFGIV